MLYSAARNFIRTGDLIGFSGTDWASTLVRWYSRSPISHVGFAIWLRFGKGSKDRLCILEATNGYGVRVRPLSLTCREHWKLSGHCYWKRLDCKINGTEAVGYALEKWGDGYITKMQFLTIVCPWIRRLRALCGLGYKLNENRFHCSNLVTYGVRRAGFVWDKPGILTTPDEVFFDFKCFNRPEILNEEDA